MTHPNRPLHRRDVESGIIDNNPYPADLKPEQLEFANSIDMMTQPVMNELDGEDVFGDERRMPYPSYSLHGKSGNIDIDKDGTYRFVGCTINRLVFATTATVIAINCRITSITGNTNDDSDTDTPQIRIILINSRLESVENAQNFYLSLHGTTKWNGGLNNCRFANVRLLQNTSWIAEDNIQYCEDTVISVALTKGAEVFCVGEYLAQHSARLRFHWHHTNLIMQSPVAVIFKECQDVLSQHHGSTIKAGNIFAQKSERVALVLHSSTVKDMLWLFSDTKQPVLSATGSHISTKDPSQGGLLDGCDHARIHLGNKTQCLAGNILTGDDGVLTMSKSKVIASTLLVDATNSTVRLTNAELIAEGSATAVRLGGSNIKGTDSELRGTNVGYDLTNTVVDFEGGRIQGDSGALKVDKCSTKLKLVKLSSDAMDVSAKGGSLTIEGGSLAKSLEAKTSGHVRLSDVSIGKDVNLTKVAATELYGCTIGGSVNATGGHFQSGGNTVSGSGNIDVGLGTMGGDTFSGSLTVKGILLIGEIDAASVTNTGFMLLEGGSGSDHLPKTQRGWHVTDSMDWVVDKDIWFNIGMNADWIVGMNQTSDVGMNVSLNAGINIDNTAGANFSNTAGATYQETAGTVIIMAAPSILENS
jgi:hypothetical protein